MGIFWTNQHWGTDVFILGHEVFHRVLREEFLELAVELPGQGLIVRYDQSRLVQCLDDVGHGEGLAGAGDAQQGLELVAFLEALHQLCDCPGLVARRLVFGMKLERFLFDECSLFILHQISPP